MNLRLTNSAGTSSSNLSLLLYQVVCPADEAVPVSGEVLELFPLCADILETLCMAVLRVCPEELTPHLHTLVTTLMPFAKHISTPSGKQVLFYF